MSVMFDCAERRGLRARLPHASCIHSRGHADRALPKILPGPEQDRPNCQMEIVDEAGAPIVAKRGYAARESNIAATRRGSGEIESRMNAVGDKVEFRAPSHSEGRQAGDGSERRPACDWAAPRPTSLSSYRPAARLGWGRTCCALEIQAPTGEAVFRDSVIDAGLSAISAVHLAPFPGREEPLHQLKTP